jgi:hypothetical protein
MWSPLGATREQGTAHESSEPIPSEEERTLGPPIEGLQPMEWMVLGKTFEGKNQKQIAAEVSRSVQTVRRIMDKPAFHLAVRAVEASMAERIARGEFGVLAIFKANAVGAAKRIVGLSRASEDERIRLQANLKIIEGAGVRPPAPAVTESPERLIDQMTAEEATKFAETGDFPERFKDQLARLATSVIEKNEQRLWTPQVDVLPLPGEDAKEEPARQNPREVVEEDEI